MKKIILIFCLICFQINNLKAQNDGTVTEKVAFKPKLNVNKNVKPLTGTIDLNDGTGLQKIDSIEFDEKTQKYIVKVRKLTLHLDKNNSVLVEN